MPIFRLYSGSDGQSHLEELSFSFMPGDIAEQSPTQAASGISFRLAQRTAPPVRNHAGGSNRDRAQRWLGSSLGAGRRHFSRRPNGKGHTTRAVGNDTRVVVIPLAR
jgi:hypothetical protein